MTKDYKHDYFKQAHQILKGRGYRSYIQDLLPGGKWQSSEWVVKNPTRNDNNASSFSVNGNTGKWGDFAIGKAGNDLIGLTAYIKGIPLVEACHYIGVPHYASNDDVLSYFSDLTKPTLNKGGNV